VRDRSREAPLAPELRHQDLHLGCRNLGYGLSILEQLLHRIVKRFRGGLVFEAHRLLYHSTLGSRVIKQKKGPWGMGNGVHGSRAPKLGVWG
jgi:hypothetical protein